MKDMNEIDKILEKKYKEIKVPDKMFDTTKLFKRIAEEKRRKKRVVKVASAIFVIVLVSTIIIGINMFRNSDTDIIEKNVDNNISASENKVNKDEVVGYLKLDLSQKFYTNQKCDYISIVEVKEILGYEIIDGVPSTRVIANVERNYLNDLEGDVEMIIPGGKFIVKELKKKLGLKDGEISLYKDNQYVVVTCDTDILISEVKPNKKYVTTTYEKDGVLYICSDLEYGFKEYDEKTNTIKDADGNSVDVDMENYLKGK